MMRLIKLFLKAPIREDDNERKPKKGTPQGGVISPLLANIYLNHLDQFWTQKGYLKYAKLVRYADDFVVLCEKNTKFPCSDGRPCRKIKYVVEALDTLLLLCES
jgi:retron-type reverse transcriptase